jgi:hypothetical protein
VFSSRYRQTHAIAPLDDAWPVAGKVHGLAVAEDDIAGQAKLAFAEEEHGFVLPRGCAVAEIFFKIFMGIPARVEFKEGEKSSG